MVSMNIDTSDGIVNGSTGYLRRIDYGTRFPSSSNDNPNSAVEKKPMRLWIEFEEERSAMKLRNSQERIRRNSGIAENT